VLAVVGCVFYILGVRDKVLFGRPGVRLMRKTITALVVVMGVLVLVGPAQADWDGDTEPPEAIGSEAVQTVAEDNPEPPEAIGTVPVQRATENDSEPPE